MAYYEYDVSDEQLNKACRYVLDAVLSGYVLTERDLNKYKKEACKLYHLSVLPSNGDIFIRASEQEKDKTRFVLQRKPVRTISGVAVIAAMTSPAPCPHGLCIPCPGGPDSSFRSPQSYMGREPAAMRAFQFNFDPYEQVRSRLIQLNAIGHDVSKAELIIMGGTFSARVLDYQEWFVKRCLEAFNDYTPGSTQSVSSFGVFNYFDANCNLNSPVASKTKLNQLPEWRRKASYIKTPLGYYVPLEEVQRFNETANIRNTGITFETRPDWALDEHIDLFLKLGGTKVELGVQSIYDDVLEKMKRGHTVSQTALANKRLRNKCFKVGFHMMPGLFNTDEDREIEGFKELFSNPDFKPDYIKLYPTLVTQGTELCRMWECGLFSPIDDETAPNRIARIKAILPKWTRLQRIQRDIPAQQILAGVRKSNIRQTAGEILEKKGLRCRCIRCREVGHNILRGVEPNFASIRIMVDKYECCEGLEHFIEFSDTKADILIGFCRLRFPNYGPRLKTDSALIRELHVYGTMLPVGEKMSPGNKSLQHRGYGKELIEKAEQTAADAGYRRISVISGIGVREYYRSLGYSFDGIYMSKNIE